MLRVEVQGIRLADVPTEFGPLTVEEMPRKTPKGCRHWHWRLPKERGTLEVTWLPSNVVIVEARSSRSAEWQSAVTENLVAYLRARSDP